MGRSQPLVQMRLVLRAGAMNLIQLKYSLFVIPLLVAACSQESSSPTNNTTPLLPSQKIKIIKGEPIPKLERADIKKVLNSIQFIKNSQMLIVSPNDSEKDISEKEKSLSALSEAEKNILLKFKDGCEIPTESIEKDGVAREKGSRAITKKSHQIKPKDTSEEQEQSCGISLQSAVESIETILESNLDESPNDSLVLKVVKEIEEKDQKKALVLSKELRLEKELAEFDFSRNLKMRLSYQEPRVSPTLEEKKNSPVQPVVVGSSTSSSLIGHIDSTSYSIEVQHDFYRDSQFNDFAITILIESPTTNVTLQAVKSKLKDMTEYYVNGDLRSAEEVLEDFGIRIEDLP
jgi:hypothetical protein